MPRLLEEIDFRNPRRAREDVARLAGIIPEAIESKLQVLLASVPDPDEALHFLERFRQRQPEAFEQVTASVTALRYLITTFSYSKFLSEEVLRHPEWLLELAQSADLHRVLLPEELEQRLAAWIATDSAGALSALSLARFRRKHLLRIMLRDVLGLATLSDVTEELSNLADAILDLTLRRMRDELVRVYGVPRFRGEKGSEQECGFAVIALGKLGGKELNYSSDIDLMFVYQANGETGGANRITNKEFFKRLANQYTQLLSIYTEEGFCYRVDLRLRPDGRLGEVAVSLEGAKNYYQRRARDWELQMLIKARVAAGNREVGRELLEFIEPLIYSTTLDFRAVEAVSSARERIGEKLASARLMRKPAARGGIDIKLAPGGIRDIEFLVQCLQRLHGGREPWVRHGGTLFALFRLRDKGLLSGLEYSRLASAYEFLRHLEHRLQFYEDRQTHTLPAASDAREIIARKMPLGLVGIEAGASMLERQLQAHLEQIQELYERIIHAQKPIYYILPAISADSFEPESASPAIPSNLTRFLDQRAPNLAAALSQAGLQRSRARFERFLERVFESPELLAQLDSDPDLVECAMDLFEHSQYFSDQLIRNPELVPALKGAPDSAEFRLEGDPAESSGALRRYFRRQMLAIQAESVCRKLDIFSTLGRTSELADNVIGMAYRIALWQAINATPPLHRSYTPQDQMLVIALGRLGMREFDLASDADLVFVLPDQDASEILFWTSVAERMIHVISAYTGEGVIFTVDPRLRPNGREGALVQSEGAYKDYFGKHAEAWEGITYMKSRAVAGNVEHATDFLHDLQEVDWRRYGQSGRSRKELAQMRVRLEKEQGANNPLKAGRGGYYDIDFALMYLRLKGAGIFYKVLNTPERIDVIEKMGHLDREEADFLRDAATFYRAIDHGLRIATGHAKGNLPTAQAQFEVLSELVRRWTPEHLHDCPLDEKLSQIRAATRQFFDRLFS